MGTDTATGETRQATAVEIDALLQEIVGLGNRRVRDRFIFAGERTDQAPFEITADGVVFHGGETAVQLQIDSSTLVPTVLTGEEASLELDFASIDLTPVLNLGGGGAVATKLADLNRGAGVPAGSISVNYGGTVATIDLSNADDIGDVKDLIEDATGSAVTVGLSGAGDALELTFAGPGALAVSDVGFGTTASELGIAGSAAGGTITGSALDPALSEFTELADLAGGAGVDGSDLTVTIGSSPAVSISASGTLGNLVQAVNAAGLPLSARISDDRRGLVIASRISGPTVTLSGVTATDLGVAGSGRAQNVFTSLIDMRDAMLAGDGDAIRASIDEVSDSADAIGRTAGRIGALARRVALTRTRLADERIELEGLFSQVVDADFAETVVKLQQQQNALEAALRAAAEVLPVSLADFL
jgi:flagellin-like hook-associated protein FlgL